MAELLKLVGSNIRRLRKQRGSTLEALAEKSDLHPKYLGGLERGEQNVSVNNLEKIATALRVKPYELMMPTGSSEPSEELVALITTADPSTQGVMLDLLKRIPEWKKEMVAKRKSSSHRKS